MNIEEFAQLVNRILARYRIIGLNNTDNMVKLEDAYGHKSSYHPGYISKDGICSFSYLILLARDRRGDGGGPPIYHDDDIDNVMRYYDNKKDIEKLLRLEFAQIMGKDQDDVTASSVVSRDTGGYGLFITSCVLV
jgi:hypothetical protein